MTSSTPERRPSSAPDAASPITPPSPAAGETKYENAKGCLTLLILGFASIAVIAVGYFLFGPRH